MKDPGDTDLLVSVRSALLDALEALSEHRDAVIVIGAQAVYLHTGDIDVALAETTKDSDVAVDPRLLADEPLIESAMKTAGFLPSISNQPGSWVNIDGIPVDLMVPEQVSGPGGRQTRGARIPPHSKKAMRRARGLEAVLIDNEEMEVGALDAIDSRTITVKVAGPSALLIAKLHKIAERLKTPDRLNDKDAHDIYRILRAIDTERLSSSFSVALEDELTCEVAQEAMLHLRDLFAAGPDGLGAVMAGRAEEIVGDPEQVAASVSFLAQDLLEALSTP